MAKKEANSTYIYLLIALGVFAAFLFSGKLQPYAAKLVASPASTDDSSSVPAPADFIQPSPQSVPLRPTCNAIRNFLRANGYPMDPFPVMSYDFTARQVPLGAYHVVHNTPVAGTVVVRVETEDSGPDFTFNTADDRRALNIGGTNSYVVVGSAPVAHGRWAIYDFGSTQLQPPYPPIFANPLIVYGFGPEGVPLNGRDDRHVTLAPWHRAGSQDDKDVASNFVDTDAAAYVMDTVTPTPNGTGLTEGVVYHQVGPNMKFDGWLTAPPSPPTDDVIAVIRHLGAYTTARIIEVRVSWSGKFAVLFNRIGTQGGFFVLYDVGPNKRYDGGPGRVDDRELVWPALNPPSDPYVTEADMSPDGRYTAFVDSYFGQNSLSVYDLGPNGRLDGGPGTGDDSISLVAGSQIGLQVPRIDGFDPLTGQTSRLVYMGPLASGFGYNFVAANRDGHYGPWPQPNGFNDDIAWNGALPFALSPSTMRVIGNRITFESGSLQFNGANEIMCNV